MFDIVRFVWISVAIGFLIAEMMTLSLTMVWFSIGAIFALIVSYITDNIIVQVLVFAFISFVLLFLVTKKLLKEDRKDGKFWKSISTNSQSFIGKRGFVIKTITPYDMGQVKVRGEIWSAISLDGSEIDIDESIEVVDIKGVKLVVKKVDKI